MLLVGSQTWTLPVQVSFNRTQKPQGDWDRHRSYTRNVEHSTHVVLMSTKSTGKSPITRHKTLAIVKAQILIMEVIVTHEEELNKHI